ncbi:response regulator [Nonomuraea salmonea]|uniref:response regulator n=1 Tax=Nonomuraea salmonea TaxID=46181 RepID=UPI0031F01CE4
MRVLVVEDERRMAAALQRGLQAEGFAVDLAHDGEDGLHAARQGDYDVIVLDIMLPRLSGYNVCKQLRAEENWVPILMLSAKDGEYDMADGLDLGGRRLPDQAVLVRGAGGQAAGADAARRRAAAVGAAGRRPVAGPGQAQGGAGGSRRSS